MKWASWVRSCWMLSCSKQTAFWCVYIYKNLWFMKFLHQSNLCTHSSQKHYFLPFFTTLLSSDLDSSSELGFDSRLIVEKITQRFLQIGVWCLTAPIRFYNAAVISLCYKNNNKVFLTEELVEELVFVSFFRFVCWCQHGVFYFEK